MNILVLKQRAQGDWVMIKEGKSTPVVDFHIITYGTPRKDCSDPPGFEDFPKEWENVGDWT